MLGRDSWSCSGVWPPLPRFLTFLFLAYPPQGPQTPSVHMATLERRQGLASGGVCAEGAGLTDGWGLPQASQLATAQATPGGNGSQMLLSGLGVSLPMYGKRRLAAVSWSSVPGLCPRGSPCGRKEVVLGGADKPSCPHRKGGPRTLHLDPSFPRNHGPRLTPGHLWGGRRGELAGTQTQCTPKAGLPTQPPGPGKGVRTPSHAPSTSGRQVVDGEARCLLAAGPNCSGDTKCELIAGPARASGPHTPGWGSFTVTQRSLLGFSYFSAAAFLGWRETLSGPPPAAAQPWSSQLPESGSPFLTSPGTSRLPSSSWQVLVHWSPEFVQPEKSHRCPGEDGPSGTIVHPGSPPPGSPPPGVCLCALPLCQLTPCVYPATSPLRHRALHLRSLLRLLTSSRPLSDKTLLFNPVSFLAKFPVYWYPGEVLSSWCFHQCPGRCEEGGGMATFSPPGPCCVSLPTG